MKQKKYKIRFHLQRGVNFRKWQVKHPNGETTYHDPKSTTIIMHQCKLVNKRKVADKIHGGQHKEVCAWVECDGLNVSKPLSNKNSYNNAVTFNPRVVPHWEHKGIDVDGERYGVLMTEGRLIHSMGN